MSELQVKNTRELCIAVQVDENNDNDYELRTIEVPNGSYEVNIYDNIISLKLKKRI